MAKSTDKETASKEKTNSKPTKEPGAETGAVKKSKVAPDKKILGRSGGVGG